MEIQKQNIPMTKHRDKFYIIKDLLSTLVKVGEINQTLLTTLCGINITKHRNILIDLEMNDLITKHEQKIGKKATIIYNVTTNGYEFCTSILLPFEQIFPRDRRH